MHRKFIALIVALAVVVTGVSASQARAQDNRNLLGGLAALALLGAAVHHYSKDEKKKNTRPVTRNVYQEHHHHYQPRHTQKVYKKKHKKHHAHKQRHYNQYPVRPLPKRVARYDLPQRCLRTFQNYSSRHPLLGPKCLNKHYKHARSLPHQCKVGFWNGKHVKRAYEPACLRQHGYRIVY